MSLQSPTDLLQSATTRLVIQSFYKTYNELGEGFLESVYEKALACVLIEAGVSVERQWPVRVFFRGNDVGAFRADILANRAAVIEIKVARKLHGRHVAQLINILRATNIEVGLLLNFGPKPEFKRIILTNDRKRHLGDIRGSKG